MRTIRMIVVMLWLFSGVANAEFVDIWTFSNPEYQVRATNLIKKLRCPSCPNQNLAESNSLLSKQLRMEIYQLIEQDRSDQQIITIMVEQFGDSILYSPPINKLTLILWFAPILLLSGLLLGSGYYLFIHHTRSATYSITGHSPDILISEEKGA